MFRRFGHLVVPLRIPILLLWIALALFLGLTAPSISEVASSDQTSFLPADANSIAARTLEAEKFAASGSASTGLLIFTREGGLTAADRGFAEATHNWLLSPQGPAIVQDVVSVFSHPEQANTLISPDSAAMLMKVNLTVEAFQPAVDEATYVIRERVEQGKPDGLAVHFTGEAGLGTDLVDSIVESTGRTTIVTVILVIALLFIIYRSPLAVLIPIITISLAYLVSRGVLGYLTQAGWQISSLLDTYMVVLVFGAGTDYSLFFISRFREELAHHSAYEAAVRSVQRIGAVISASAITTMVGLSALGFARFGLVKTMGPGLAVAVGITLLAGLTLTPALLSLFGRHLFWPRKTSVENTQPSAFWVKVSNLVAIRPLIPVIVISVLLALPYLGLLQYRENLSVVGSLPKTTDSRQGFDAIAEHFPQGEFAPAVVLLQLPESTDLSSTRHLRALAELQDRLLALDSVNRTRSILDPIGDGTTDAFRVPTQLDQISASLLAPAAGGERTPAQQANEAVSQVGVIERYVEELAAAFPDVAQGAQFSQAREALASFSTAAADLHTQAHPTTQLRQMAEQLRQSPPAQGALTPATALAPVGRYLAEMSEAFPDVIAQPAYAEATQLLEDVRQLEQNAAASSSLSTQQRLAQQSQFQALSGGIATQLDQLAGYFADRPDAAFLPSDLAAQQGEENPLGGATRDLAEAFAGLREAFSAYPHPYLIPTTLPGVEEASQAIAPLFFSEDKTTIRFFVILGEDPLSAGALSTLDKIRETLQQDRPGPLASASAFVGGATAESADIKRVVRGDLQAVGIITVVGIFAVLAILLRSLVAPLYLVGTVVFSYGSSLGLSTLLFQGVLGHEGVYYLLPLMVMVMLIALGADYNVFLVHRIREESATLPLREGVRIATARTGAIITAAGVILAGTFAALTAAPLQFLFQMGAAIALGILIDALVVRSLLVPGIVTLVGKANWWPVSIRANWWPLLPAGASAPLVGGQGLARGVVFMTVALLIAVTFATRSLWYPETVEASTRVTARSTPQAPAVPSPTPLILAVPPTAVPTPIASNLPTPTPTPSLAPTPTIREYVVQAGDTLTAIAQQYSVTVTALAEFNQITDPNVISVGQRLQIPP